MKEKMQTTTRNHYVPQAYLRKWSEDGVNIYLYNRLVSHDKVPLWCKKNIKNICYSSNLYSNTQKMEIDEFEEWITLEVETPYLAIVNKILEGESLSYEDNLIISKYVIVQHLRTPAYYKRFAKIVGGVDFKELTFEVMSNLSYKKSNYTSSDIINTSEDTYKFVHEDYPISTNVVKNENEIEIYVEALLGRDFWLASIPRLSNNIEEYSKKIKWTIIDSNLNDEWLTSDNPVVLCNEHKGNYNLDGNWGVKNTKIIFPVSPQKLLYAKVGERSRILNNSPKFQDWINKLIIENSLLHVFSTKGNSYLKYEDRLVDEKIYKDIVGKINNMHVNFLKSEKAFMENNKKM